MKRTSLPADRWVGGFNLLPWRWREARRLRRRRALEWLAAALLGCACAAPLAGWRVWQRTQIEREQRVVEQSRALLRAPLAEQQRLVREAGERRARAAASREQAKPLVRFVALLDGLAAANVDGVALHQVVHRAHETGLQASTNGETATAAWLARLRSLPDVAAVSVHELKRAAAGGARADERLDGSLQLTARVVWAGASADGANATVSRPDAGTARGRSIR